MAVRATLNGKGIHFSGGDWYYDDTGELVPKPLPDGLNFGDTTVAEIDILSTTDIVTCAIRWAAIVLIALMLTIAGCIAYRDGKALDAGLVEVPRASSTHWGRPE